MTLTVGRRTKGNAAIVLEPEPVQEQTVEDIPQEPEQERQDIVPEVESNPIRILRHGKDAENKTSRELVDIVGRELLLKLRDILDNVNVNEKDAAFKLQQISKTLKQVDGTIRDDGGQIDGMSRLLEQITGRPFIRIK